MAVAVKKHARAKVDPELRRQLKVAEQHGEPVEAVLMLNSENGAPPSAERVSELTREILERAARESGLRPEDVNVFRHLASFVVRAKPEFVRMLVEQPEIASVVANHPSEASLPAAASGHAKRARRTRSQL
jgi:hypothetical protein